MTSNSLSERIERWRISTNLFPISLWAFLRILLLFWGAIVILILPVRALSLAGDPPRVQPQGLDVLLEPWARWDTMWYLRIAMKGYSPADHTGGFFPLFPLLIRGLALVIPNPLLCSIIISSLATLGAMLIFFQLATELAGEPIARRALLYWFVFPTTFYFFAGYAESVSMFLALWSLQSARRGNWPYAGLAAGLAAISRPPGLLVLVPIGIEWLQAHGSITNRIRRALWLTPVPIALGLLLSYFYFLSGDAFMGFHAWKNVTVLPWVLPFMTLQNITAGVALPHNIIDLSLTGLIVILTVIGVQRVPWSFTGFAVSLILVQMTGYAPFEGLGDIPMNGMARRMIIVFPAFLTLAQVWKGRFREPLLVGVSLSLQLVFTSIFVRWLWLD